MDRGGKSPGFIEMRSGKDLGNAEVDQELGASAPLGIVHGGRDTHSLCSESSRNRIRMQMAG